ncbi:MAG: DEAD/DEAH box helicase [bacterium]
MSDILPFHPSIQRWFADQYPAPTEVQKASWPLLASGQHALITAPTGSGKTLTAFLWSLSQFASGAYPTGQTKVLYISPLKALNNDIQRNLTTPLAQMTAAYNFPDLKVQTRSGDTSPSQRQRMLRTPPDILITTPESLGLLLTTRKGQIALSQVATVILDEIHALVDNRRGASLMVNIERLADIAGEFQRIALSATVSPLAAVADYVAGYTAQRQARQVQIVNTPGDKKIDFRISFPADARQAAQNGEKIWDPLSKHFKTTIAGNTSTLFFTNSRRLAEKITLKINEEEAEPLAYAHHGSLAREVRTEVERRLKGGELKAIVATNSLEMGIDIGALDEVVLVQCPPSVAACLQRIGRAGHQVGETSIGTLFPTHAHDFLEAAVLSRAIAARDIEPQQMMRAPLDILAQLIISICANESWHVDQLYQLITRATPYQRLQREQFDQVIEMLAGRYSGSRIRELRTRLDFDRIEQTVKANRGAVLAMYNSGGTIPDRGYYQLRHADHGAVLGELDEEFVWEASVGQTFTLGTAAWQIRQITHNDVLVHPAPPDRAAPPFWRSEFFNRSLHFSNRITEYLESVEAQLGIDNGKRLLQDLTETDGFEATAAEELVDYLKRQRVHTGAPLPHRHHLLVERIHTGPAGYHGPNNPQQLVLHTFWGGRLNQPWAMAMQAAWRARFDSKLEIHADNDAIVAQIEGQLDPHVLLSLVTAANFAGFLRLSLEQSGFFGARFRECAGRALLLTKARFNQRLPLWMSRLQAKKLMTQVKALDNFPVMIETWRTCLDDEFDIPALLARLEELASGEIRWSLVETASPSPFARNLTFGQVSRYMYADDTPDDETLSSLSTDVISQALHNDALRPKIDPEVIRIFEAKRQRRYPGYEPSAPDDWSAWLKERILIPAQELPESLSEPSQLRWIKVGKRRWATHAELERSLYSCGLVPGKAPQDSPVINELRTALEFSQEVLSFYGPLTETDINELLPTIPAHLFRVDENFIQGELVTGDTHTYWCDAQNFESLMRFARATRRSDFTALPITALPAFWASHQQFGRRFEPQSVVSALERLRAYPCAVATWWHDLLPARLTGMQASAWDAQILDDGFTWLGAGKEQIIVGYPEDLELVCEGAPTPDFAEHFADPNAGYRFDDIAGQVSINRNAFNDSWWQAVWSGGIHSDSFAPLRIGIERRFTLGAPDTQVSSRRRLRRSAPGWQGNWQLFRSQPPQDALSRLEADKDIVRLLLDRYGWVNREIVNRERLPNGAGRTLVWRDAFRALRIMELAGEVLTGHFFAELASPQFITASAYAELKNTPTLNHWWLAATDPASPCGLGLAWPELPQRRINNYLSFSNQALAAVFENGGKQIRYYVAPEDENLPIINSVLTHLVDVRRQHVQIETINHKPARSSPYLSALQRQFEVVSDHRNVTVQPSF